MSSPILGLSDSTLNPLNPRQPKEGSSLNGGMAYKERESFSHPLPINRNSEMQIDTRFVSSFHSKGEGFIGSFGSCS